MTDDKALELYEQCDRELPDRGDLGSFKRLIGAFARALLTTPPAAALAPVATKRTKLPPIGNELYEHYVSMSAQTHEALIKEYARACIAAPTPSTPAPLVFDDWFELYMADKAEADRDLERRAAIAGWIAAHKHWSKSSTPAPVAEYIATLPADWHVDSSFETWFPLKAEELESTKRMFLEACSDLGLISEKLGIDPDEAGGAGPILDAIEELKCATPPTRPDVGDAQDVEFGKSAEFWKQRHDQKEADCVRLVNEKMDSWEKGFLLGCSLYLKDAKRYTHIKTNARSGSIGFSGQWIGTDDFEGQLDSLVDDLILSQEKDAMLAPQSSEKEDQVIAAKPAQGE